MYNIGDFLLNKHTNNIIYIRDFYIWQGSRHYQVEAYRDGEFYHSWHIYNDTILSSNYVKSNAANILYSKPLPVGVMNEKFKGKNC